MKSMRRIVIAAGLVLVSAGAAWAEDAVGKWTGVVKTPEGGEIPLNVTVTKGTDGKLAATVASPTQAPGVEIPTENVTSDGKTLGFEVGVVTGSYSGTWDATKKTWVGTWKQDGEEMQLDLAKAA
jgi:hypothetical protein